MTAYKKIKLNKKDKETLTKALNVLLNLQEKADDCDYINCISINKIQEDDPVNLEVVIDSFYSLIDSELYASNEEWLEFDEDEDEEE